MPILPTDDFSKYKIPAQAEVVPDNFMIRKLEVNWADPLSPINAYVELMPYSSTTGQAFPQHLTYFTLEDIATLSQTDAELAHVFDSIVALVNRIAKEKGKI